MAGDEYLDDLERCFTAALINEAGQAIEPDSIVAFTRLAHSGRGCLVGDPQILSNYHQP